MTYDIQDSFDACIARIEEDFDIQLSAHDHAEPAVLLRGESCPWPTTESSMHRFSVQDDGKTMKSPGLVMPFYDFQEDYSDYLAERFGTTRDDALGFLQHYGFPTDLFDVSPSSTTARFFATNQHPEKCGTIGVFPVPKLKNHFKVIDLSRRAFADRPRRQTAYAIKPHNGSWDLKNEESHECLGVRWYRFRKSAEDRAFARDRKALLLPSAREVDLLFGEDLRQYMESHWTRRHEDWRRYASPITDKLDAIFRYAGIPSSDTDERGDLTNVRTR